MIRAYTGTPGAGKSLHSMKKVLDFLKAGKNVIANFPIKSDKLKKSERKGKFFYLKDDEISVNFLYQFKEKYHSENEENQTLLIIDEASIKFNCRESSKKDRLEFCNFFAQHRKFGYSVILICQNMRQIDRQIRDLIELEVIHRKMNNISFFCLLPFALFVAVEKNVTIKQKNDHELFFYNKRLGNLYDTFYDFKMMGNEKIAITKEFEEKIISAEFNINNSTNKPPERMGAWGTRRLGGFISSIRNRNSDINIFEDDSDQEESDILMDIMEDMRNGNSQSNSKNNISNDDNYIFYNC